MTPISVVAINRGKTRFMGSSGMGCGLPRRVIVVPSVCMTMVPDAIVV